MKKLVGFAAALILFWGSVHVYAEGNGKEVYDYTNPGFSATVNMLYMDGHSNDDLANCTVKQEYYQDVAEMYFTKGMSKQEILDYYKNELGEFALNAPPAKGFNLSLWVTPFILILAVSLVLFILIKKWRNNQVTASVEDTLAEPDIEQDIYQTLIEAERKKFI